MLHEGVYRSPGGLLSPSTGHDFRVVCLSVFAVISVSMKAIRLQGLLRFSYRERLVVLPHLVTHTCSPQRALAVQPQPHSPTGTSEP